MAEVVSEGRAGKPAGGSAEPVRVESIGGVEQIVYKSADMEEGKQYIVKWGDRHYMLVKKGSGVEISRSQE